MRSKLVRSDVCPSLVRYVGAVALSLAAIQSNIFAQGAISVFEVEPPTIASHDYRVEALADVDGDGQVELVGWWPVTNAYRELRVSTWTRDQDLGTWPATHRQHFGPTGNYDPAKEPATAVGDFDNDGKDEMLIVTDRYIEAFGTSPGSQALVRYFSQYLQPALAPTDRDVAVHDFDGNGRDDLVIVSGETLFMYRSKFNGGFERVAEYHIGVGPLSVAVADVEGDSAMEVLVLQELAFPRLHRFTVSGMTFSPSQVSVETNSSVVFTAPSIKLVTGDVDGDLDTDVLLFGTNGVYQLLRRSPAGLTLETPRQGGPATDLADLDGDGDLDGLCCGGGGGSNDVHNTTSSVFELCMNDGTGSFDMAVPIQGVGARHVAGAVDFDGDGDFDVVAGRSVVFNYGEVGVEFCTAANNSTGNPGLLSASGRHSYFHESGAQFAATGLPPGTLGIMMGGPIAGLGFDVGVGDQPFWDGQLCLTGSLKRYTIVQANGAGDVAIGGPASGWLGSPTGIGTVLDGTMRVYAYQLWYRDVAGQSGANITNAVRVSMIK